MYEGPTISCDSHILEVPEIFAGLKDRFGEDAPGIFHDPARGEVLSLGGGSTYNLTVGRFGIAGHWANDPATQEMIRQGYSAMRPGVLNPLARIEDQERDGIDAEVLLPSVLLGLNTIPRPEIIAATYKNYNDWVYNYASQAPKRLYPTACVPLHDVNLAIEELRRAKAMGHVGANIPCVPPLDKPYSDRYYDPFWAEAQELGTPLVMHFLTSSLPNHGLPSTEYGTGYGLAAYAIQRVISSIIASGVCARFPRLQFVPTEWETGWVAHFLKRMDWSTYVNRNAMAPECDMSFSDYFRQNFHVTFEDDLVGIQTRHGIGVRNLMWGSDFPHHDSTFPRSQAVLEEIFDGVPDDERYLITAGNCIELYKLPIE